MPTYATFDPGYIRPEFTLSNGDLTATINAPAGWQTATATIPKDTGFGYAEFTGSATITTNFMIGLMLDGTDISGGGSAATGILDTYGHYGLNSSTYLDGVIIATSVGFSFPSDVISVRYDNHLFEILKNGLVIFTTTTAAGSWLLSIALNIATDNITINTGQSPFTYPSLDTGGAGWSEGGGGGGGIMGNICKDICSNIG